MYTAPYYIALLTLSFAPLMVTDGHFFPCTNFEFSLSGSLSLFFFSVSLWLASHFLGFRSIVAFQHGIFVSVDIHVID